MGAIMRIFIKDMGGNIGEAWVEDWLPKADDFEITCRAKLLFMGKNCLIDTIDTPIKFRKKGYATALVKELQKYFDKVEPIGVRLESKGFWDKLGLEDALGEER